MSFHDAHRADFDAQGVAAEFGNEGELVHVGGGLDVVIIAQAAEVGPALADFQGAQQDPARGLPPRSPARMTLPAGMFPARAWASSTSAQGRTEQQPAASA